MMSVFFPGAAGAATNCSRTSQNTNDTVVEDTSYDTFIGSASGSSAQNRASASLKAPAQRGISPSTPARSPMPADGLGASLISLVLTDNDAALDKLLRQYTSASSIGQVLNETRHQEKTLMMLAAADGLVSIGRTLLRNGADPLVGNNTAPPDGFGSESRSDARLGSPMHLAAVAGHGDFVALLLAHGVRVESCLQALQVKVFPGVVAALRDAGAQPSVFKSLLDTWVTRPDGHEEAGFLIEQGGAVPDIKTLMAAVTALRPFAVELLSKCSTVDVNDALVVTRSDDNVYRLTVREEKTRKKALRVALESYAPENAEALEQTVGVLVRAGVRATSADLSLATKAENVALVRMCVAAKAPITAQNLLEVAYSGHVTLAAYFLDSGKFSQKELDEAAVRAQDNGFAVLANLFNAKKAVLAATAEHHKLAGGVLQGAYHLLSGPATAGRRQHAALALESATERYERLISGARVADRKDTANPSLPAPAAASNNQSLVLARR